VVGGGIWQPEPKTLKKIRDRIVAKPEAWRRVVFEHEFGSVCSMSGQVLTRPPAGYDPDHPFIEDLRRKDFVFSSGIEDRKVASRNLADLVIERFRASAPLMRFLSSAVGIG
jgi:uncharacterized protein (TIGR02453 family)